MFSWFLNVFFVAVSFVTLYIISRIRYHYLLMISLNLTLELSVSLKKCRKLYYNLHITISWKIYCGIFVICFEAQTIVITHVTLKLMYVEQVSE